MLPHQERVATERDELVTKLVKLESFLLSEMFTKLDPEEQTRLRRQCAIMQDYRDVLNERIAAF